jgi:predicted RNA binding protein YcfA (HicA-like mRNA interferase family)
MPKLKVLSGEEIVKILASFGFEIEAQHGSHVKLRRLLSDGERQTLTIPLHDELDRGTMKAIYRQAARYVPEDQLRTHFYG